MSKPAEGRIVVYLEGLDKVGKSTLLEQLKGYRTESFYFLDRGPWSRYAIYLFRGNEWPIRAMEHFFRIPRSPTIIVYVTRDLDRVVDLQRGEEGFSREELEEQDRLFRLAFERFPPDALIELKNDSDSADLASRAKIALHNVLAEWN